MNGSAKLDTGMRVDEAIRRARNWWQEWRGSISTGFNQVVATRSTTGDGLPGVIIHETHKAVLPSGILSGKPWDQLNEREQLQIVKIWHHNHVRDPMSADYEYRLALAEAYREAGQAKPS